MTMNVGGKETKREDQEMAEEVKEEDKSRFDPYEYSCHILLENTTLEKANDKSFPTDAYLVWYNVDGKELLDVTRSHKKSNIFDMYYDKYKKDLKRIDWGSGTKSPSMWGYKQPEKKKRRKS
jgi:hypothetical protein|tara:strand:- start:465 stop:830 length:366 start_codon:yes stop_codon:yes gene_type:complete